MNGVAIYCDVGKIGEESGFFFVGGTVDNHAFCSLHVKFEMPKTSR